MADRPSDPLRPPSAAAAEMSQGRVYRVGEWTFTEDRRELARDGRVRRLEPKAAAVLGYLVRRADRVVSRDELLAAVWPQPYVTPDVLTQAVYQVRRALGDDAREARHIETIPRTGYRLAAPVGALPTRAVGPPEEPPSGAASNGARVWLEPPKVAAALAALGLLALAGLGLSTVRGTGVVDRDALPWTPGPAQVAERGWAILAASRPGAAAEALRLAETSLARHGASCEALALGAAAWAESAAAGEWLIAEGFERARAMADAALAVDPRCHRALLGRGLARWLGEWDWSGAEADLQRRLAAAPWDSATRAAYAQLLLFGGREAAARDEIARALGRAPDSVEARLTAALISWMMDRPEEAREHYLHVLRQDPGHPEARTSLAKLARGPVDSAADSAANSAASPGDGVPLQRLEEMAGKRRLRPGHVAVLYAETGRSGEALEWLERAVAEHDPTVLFFRFDRRWDPLREHPRYRRAMASLGLPAASAAS